MGTEDGVADSPWQHLPFLSLSLTSPNPSEVFASGLSLYPQVISLVSPPLLHGGGASPCPDCILSPQLIGATGISYGAGLKQAFGVDIVGKIPTG